MLGNPAPQELAAGACAMYSTARRRAAVTVGRRIVFLVKRPLVSLSTRHSSLVAFGCILNLECKYFAYGNHILSSHFVFRSLNAVMISEVLHSEEQQI